MTNMTENRNGMNKTKDKIKKKIMLVFRYDELQESHTDLRLPNNFKITVKVKGESICLTKYDEHSKYEQDLEKRNIDSAEALSGYKNKFESEVLFINYNDRKNESHKDKKFFEKLKIINGKFRNLVLIATPDGQNAILLECILDKDKNTPRYNEDGVRCTVPDDAVFDMTINREDSAGNVSTLSTISADGNTTEQQVPFEWL